MHARENVSYVTSKIPQLLTRVKCFKVVSFWSKLTNNLRICMMMYVFAFAFGLLLTSMFDQTILIDFSSSHVKSHAWRPGPNTRSVLRPGDSTVMQLVYIVHKMYEVLEEGSGMRAVFLDISKAFDRVWHRGLIAKLRSIGVEGNLLKWFISYLSSRKQRVIIERVHSDWCNTEAGVLQGSVLGPLLFLIYINDLPTTITSNCFLFADDCFLLEKVQ